MGFIGKVMNGKKRHFKVYRKCNDCKDTSVRVVTSLSGRDLKALSKEYPKKVLTEVYGDCCDKCEICIDEVAYDEVRKAKKVFSSKEVE